MHLIQSESGPTAAAWHAHKFLDPKESGAVIPVLHVNGFKISERTIPGTSDNTELAMLYSGYGYQVRFVEYDTEDEYVMGGVGAADRKMHLNLAASLDWYAVFTSHFFVNLSDETLSGRMTRFARFKLLQDLESLWRSPAFP